jgi:hypothetical protein
MHQGVLLAALSATHQTRLAWLCVQLGCGRASAQVCCAKRRRQTLGEPVFFSVFFIFLVKKSKIAGQKYNFGRIDTEFLTKMVA